jgi:cytochrome d ubiquinol oxidase subunit I
MESTFIAVMFFGWNKVGKRFHLLSSWLVAVGASLSALWILVANAWMQNPVGMVFNPETARNEMINFWQVLFNPVATDKFLHTITSGFVLASMFVLGISSWFLIKKREALLARRSILVAGVFGLLSSLLIVYTGDSSARTIAKYQPVKFAAFEALYEGKENAGLVTAGILKNSGEMIGEKEIKDFVVRIEIPGFLSIMTGGSPDTYVIGMKDLISGNPGMEIMSAAEKIQRGKYARDILTKYKAAVSEGDNVKTAKLLRTINSRAFREKFFKYFGYGFISSPDKLIPDVQIAFYSFHLMVLLGFLFIAIFIVALYLLFRGSLSSNRWFLWIALFSIPLPYIASELGWVLTEMGRQPWIIQDLMPVSAGVSQIGKASVQTTFFLFAFLFTVLAIAEVSIMIRQIKSGPAH